MSLKINEKSTQKFHQKSTYLIRFFFFWYFRLMVSTYFSLICTSQRLTFTYVRVHTHTHTHVRARASKCVSHVATRVRACVHAGNIFDAACPDVSKLSLYIDYRVVLDREESRLSSEMRESLISREKILLATSAIDIHSYSGAPRPPRNRSNNTLLLLHRATCRGTYKQRNPWT